MKLLFNFIISAVWCSLTAFSRLLYRFNLRRSFKLPVRVIAVGNFEVGGTGKTPVVAQIAREAIDRGFHPVILTRGYGGRWERSGGVIAPNLSTAKRVSPAESGDEPALLQELLPSVWIGIGADRVRSFETVRARAKAQGLPAPDLVILDDGLQHLRIQRDFEVVLATGARPWRKIFREFPSTRDLPCLYAWTKGAEEPFRSSAFQPLVRLRWKSEVRGQGSVVRPLWLVTGVADSEQVRKSVEDAGWRVVAHSVYRDHAKYSREWLEELAAKARSGGLKLATTGKDWVKWRELAVNLDDTVVFEPEIVWDAEGRRQWLRALWAE